MRKSVYRIFLYAASLPLAISTPGQLARARTTVHAPYTAHFHTTRTQRLADGNVIRTESTETLAVDAQGRRMTTLTEALPFGSQTLRTTVFVFDPTAHTNTNWMSPGRQATVSTMPEPGAQHGCPASSTDTNSNASRERSERSKPVIEDLGADTFQGIEAHGRRIIRTIPAGEVGNQSPLVTTSESWTATAPALSGMIVREITDDPRSGTRTKELVSYELGDPDPAVFQPPASYEIVKNTFETSCTSRTVSTPPQ